MFNQVIDTIQTSKKQIVTTFVQDKKFQEELIKLIDSQTEFTKKQVHSTCMIAEALIQNSKEQMEILVSKSAFGGK